ncbi:putative DNA damage-binding protein 1 [Blattamonas nauphoetae]|uniref:DNA damage-binding protein 1 n=1 Tax=Blattamonas nauphoetae TaxID=2049346 RepID=A0ABQ9Y034_9EUKA|nr:putative DNA damage-binding protein 1 [Blattamonas nauphoetae]
MAITSKYQLLLLDLDPKVNRLVSRGSCSVRDVIGRPSESGGFLLTQPGGNAAVLHLYNGLLKVVPLDEEGLFQEPFNLAMEQMKIIDMHFFPSRTKNPNIVILIEQPNQSKLIRFFELDINNLRLRPLNTSLNLDTPLTAHSLIPFESAQSLAILSLHTLQIVRSRQTGYSGGEITVPGLRHITASLITSDGRLLMSDRSGSLLLATFPKPTQPEVVDLGHLTCASSITELDRHTFFVGSALGDSHVISIDDSLDTTPSFTIHRTIPSVAPTVDGALIPSIGQPAEKKRNVPQKQDLALCCGGESDGRLCVVQRGVVLKQLASLRQHPHFRTLFSFPELQMIVASTSSRTDVLQTTLDIPAIRPFANNVFEAHEKTLVCRRLQINSTSHIIQVTPTKVVVVSQTGSGLADWVQSAVWTPPSFDNLTPSRCTHAVAGPHSIIIALAHGYLIRLELVSSKEGHIQVNVTHTQQLNSDVSALSLDQSGRVFAALWDHRILVLDALDISILSTFTLETRSIVRSLLHLSSNTHSVVLAGTGNGSLFSLHFSLETHSLSSCLSFPIGIFPLSFVPLGGSLETGEMALICCDRPTIVTFQQPNTYQMNKHGLTFETVNAKAIHTAALLPITNGLIISCDEELAMVTHSFSLNNTPASKSLHIRSTHLGGQARRIGYDEDTHTLVVGYHRNPDESTLEEEPLPVPDEDVVFQAGPVKRLRQTTLDEIRPGKRKRYEQGEPLNVLSNLMSDTETDLQSRTDDVDVIELFDPTSLVSNDSTVLEKDEVILSIVPLTLSLFTPTHTASQHSQFALASAFSAQSTQLENSFTAMCVGTAFVNPNQVETTMGRILVFRLHTANGRRQMELVTQTEVAGAVLRIAQLSDGRFCATINNRITVYEIHTSARTGLRSQSFQEEVQAKDSLFKVDSLAKHSLHLSRVCQRASNVMAVALDTDKNFICVGDIVRSVALYRFNPRLRTIQALAVDVAPRWISDLTIGTSHDNKLVSIFIADINGNLHEFKWGNTCDDTEDEESELVEEFVWDTNQPADDPTLPQHSPITLLAHQQLSMDEGPEVAPLAAQLQLSASFHVGVQPNRIIKSLSSRVFGPVEVILSAEGAVFEMRSTGSQQQNTELCNLFTFSQLLSTELLHVLPHTIENEWEEFRKCAIGTGNGWYLGKELAAKGVVDTDLLHRFGELSLSDQQKVAARVGFDVEQVILQLNQIFSLLDE